jgi:hypothetical protein
MRPISEAQNVMNSNWCLLKSSRPFSGGVTKTAGQFLVIQCWDH